MVVEILKNITTLFLSLNYDIFKNKNGILISNINKNFSIKIIIIILYKNTVYLDMDYFFDFQKV